MDGIKTIVKRDGRTVEFNIDKIATAIYKAAEALGGHDRDMANYLAKQTELYLTEVCNNDTPSVEEIQDAVEKILIENGHARTAKEYILYRAERTRVRDMNTRLMKTYENLTSKKPKTTMSSVRTRTSTATLPWAPCSSTAVKARNSSTRCMY